ncbi:MAG: cytochrome c3 family protein [Phycisphaerales bacterium]
MKRTHKILLVVLVVAYIAACQTLVPRKGWNKSYGPVVPHDTFPADCSLCHEGGTWNKIKDDFQFDHERETGVPLNGAHASAQCLLCHNDRGPVQQFSAQGCAGCHQDVHRGRLGASCTDCHNETTWRPKDAIAQHNRTRFPLVGAHASIDCTRCHPGAATGNFEQPSVACEACHAGDATRSTTLDHLAQGITDRCDRCHTPVAWLPAGFDHPQTFPLTLGHAGISCSTCHTTPGTFTGLSTDCASCHQSDFQATTDPNHQSANFSTSCLQCHTTLRWQGATFNHTASFPLTLGHANRRCSECHTTPGNYAGQSPVCSACHLDNYQATSNPNHTTAGFSTNCTDCHNTLQWQGANFTHPSTFPLTLGHANVSCTACHTTPGVYTGLSTTCSACHLDNFQATTNPNHQTSGFSTNCTECHTTLRWQGASFQHPSTFPLTNAHASVACSACHTTPGVYTGLSTACSSCHLSDFQSTTNPNHQAANISTNCTQCHSTIRWTGAVFPHTPSFPLTNGHAGHSCTACHTTPGVYTGQSAACSSCHLDDYQRVTNPNHVTSGFSTNCTDCHNTIQWQGANFQHPSSFPLTLGHAGVACVRCHTTPGVYTGNSTACASCHTTDYQQTTNPYHQAAGISTNCVQCHNTAQWQGATFNHTSAFPLTNAHANRQCTDCHRTPGVYTGLSRDCVSCHLPAFQSTTNPNHVSAGFSTNCTQCHTTIRWTGAVFNHPASFPLTQGHANRACSACHTTPNVYTGLSTQCSFCHLDDYQGVTNPNHVSAGFSTNCTQCHTTLRWTGAVFNHPASFPLTQAHANRSCSECHTTPNVYTGLSTQCSFCHLNDYQATTNPNHAQLGYPTNCTTCHTPTLWANATFNHPSVNRSPGGHRNLRCVDCHTVPAATPAYSCTHCHEHNQTSMANEHRNRQGYQWVSSACYNCHY